MKPDNADPSTVAEETVDDISPEYDFSQGRPNKYAERYAKGSILVTLDPDVAAAFPDSAKVNETLRALAGLIRAYQGGQSKKGRSV